ncbi:N-acetylated-alpha-linked acidic dipeptidase 2 [Holothuria leucospilota]|uniref:N-acetylated-alpha-linked acidic dipeptidase 2 n=1 Tax=Holothuria leucospilota TaxID=206669 RepID=A0A9Q1CNB9_HOLLE|nr:N-acetylated-alpha-linked acidic dipeptidase 2 [Holothuria leucospilota]
MKARSLIVIAVSIIVVGILISWFSGPGIGDSTINDTRREADPTISKKLMDLIDNVKIDENLRFLTSEPHVAGKPRQRVVAEWIRDQYLDYGFDEAEIFTYNVLLSYPSELPGEESVIQRLVPDERESDGYRVEYESQIDEPPLDDTASGKDVIPPFNAYSATGTVEGELVYANYGRVEDFFFLEREKGINLTDKIIIARYGRLFRGDKFAAAFEKRLGTSQPRKSITQKWEELRNNIHRTALAIIGKKTSKSQDWFEAKSSEMVSVIEAKRTALI